MDSSKGIVKRKREREQIQYLCCIKEVKLYVKTKRVEQDRNVWREYSLHCRTMLFFFWQIINGGDDDDSYLNIEWEWRKVITTSDTFSYYSSFSYYAVHEIAEGCIAKRKSSLKIMSVG